MANSCDDKSCEITALRESPGRVLWIVLTINALMFLVEGWAGLLAHSTSLLADALDMLGDALVYGFSLFVLTRNSRWQAGADLVKGGFMLALGLGVLRRGLLQGIPSGDAVGRYDGGHRKDCARCKSRLLLPALPASGRQTST